MIFIGMIYQYDSNKDTGLIMLSDGQNKEFTLKEWEDVENRPTVGQKIAYEDSGDGFKVRVATQEDIENIQVEEEKESSNESVSENITIEEHLNKFTSIGFKLVKETSNDNTRTLLLRSFATGESEEIIITQIGAEVTITQTLNGKPIL